MDFRSYSYEVMATVPTAGVSIGTYNIVPSYSGSSLYLASSGNAIPITVVALNDPTITLAANPNPVTPPTSITLTATVGGVSGVATPTGTVDFYYGSTLLGSSKLNGSGIATFSSSTSGLATGTYDITANYLGDQNYVANSTTLAVMVK